MEYAIVIISEYSNEAHLKVTCSGLEVAAEKWKATVEYLKALNEPSLIGYLMAYTKDYVDCVTLETFSTIKGGVEK